MLRNNYI